MRALRTTSDELRQFPIERQRLKPYAGPQCFPHLKDPARKHANKEEGGATSEVGADVARKQLTECWLQCDKCRKWRLVERSSLPAVKPEAYSKRREGCVDFDWGRWLRDARTRYEAFMHRHSGQECVQDPETAEMAAEVNAAEHISAGQDGDDEEECARVLSEDSASVDVATSECGSDDEGRNANEKGERLAAAWGRALVRLRVRGGGMTTEERKEQRRLSEKERSRDVAARGRRSGGGTTEDAAGGATAGPEEARRTRVVFTCDMLLREERTRKDGKWSSEWIGMKCADPDDFQSLKERRWSTETQFKAKESVILWRKDASAPPSGQDGYVRSGEVLKVVLAGEAHEDPEIARYDLRPRAGRPLQERYSSTDRVSNESKVV